MEPYRRLSRRPQSAKDSVLIPPPTNPFAGITYAFPRRDWTTGLAALAGVLSKFTPILLSNIPFNPTQTWTLHVACTWTTAAILGFMLLALLSQMATKYPDLPVNPKFVSGTLYYLSASRILCDFQDASTLTQKDFNSKSDAETRYSLKNVNGTLTRMTIEVEGQRSPSHMGTAGPSPSPEAEDREDPLVTPRRVDATKLLSKHASISGGRAAWPSAAYSQLVPPRSSTL